MRTLRLAAMAVLALVITGCGYNRFQTQDEQIKSAWSEVLNQYQRRADLVPNLVNTVKGYAAQEQKIFIDVAEARSKVGSIQATPELVNDPAGLPEIPGRPSRAVQRAVAPDRGVGELSAAEIRCQLPRSAGPARGHREPHHGRAQSLYPGGAGLQRHRCAASPAT